MKQFGQTLRQLREKNKLLLRQVAAVLEVDTALISKFESGDRKPTREQVTMLAKLYKANEKELMIQFLSEKLAYEVQDEEYGLEALQVAEEKFRFIHNVNGTTRTKKTRVAVTH